MEPKYHLQLKNHYQKSNEPRTSIELQEFEADIACLGRLAYQTSEMQENIMDVFMAFLYGLHDHESKHVASKKISHCAGSCGKLGQVQQAI